MSKRKWVLSVVIVVIMLVLGLALQSMSWPVEIITLVGVLIGWIGTMAILHFHLRA